MEKHGLIVLCVMITQNQRGVQGLNHLNGQRVSRLLLNEFSFEIYHYLRKWAILYFLYCLLKAYY